MADEKTSGLILRTRPLTETSLIVHWLTPDLGRVATVAKGARRAKSPFRGKLDLFYEAEFSFGRSARSELHNLREVSLHETHSALRNDMPRLQQACYATGLVEQTTEVETPMPEVFEVVSGFIRFLSTREASAMSLFALELKMLEVLGQSPELDSAELSPGARQLALHALEGDWEAIPRLRASHAQEEELRRFLHGFLIYHLGRIPRGRGW
jgi:DNA repair protein RecO (recombination protein O)